MLFISQVSMKTTRNMARLRWQDNSLWQKKIWGAGSRALKIAWVDLVEKSWLKKLKALHDARSVYS